MARALLIRGMLAGLVAGLLAFAFAWIVGEPAVSGAISFETQRAAAEGAAPYVPIVSRDVQSTLGLLTAVLVYGVALGGMFSLVFAGIYGRLRRATPTRTALELAAAAFVVVYLVPFLKYPANPPAVGQPDTIQQRTALYLAMLAVSVAGAVYSVWLRGRLAPRLGGDRALLVSIACYLLIVLVGGLVLPGVNEVPSGFPAVTLWNFRVGSVGIQAITWATIGLLFGYLAERALSVSVRERRADAPRPGAAS